MTVRTARPETDVPAITHVTNQCNESDTEDEVRSWMLYNAPGRIALHFVCVDEQDAVIGYGNLIHTVESPACHFYAWVGVVPSLRCQGIGSVIWNTLLDSLRTHRATQVVCDVLEKEPAGMAFAKKRGFVIDRHKYRSVLELSTFDETPFLPMLAALEAQGFRFCTLAEIPDDPDTQRKYYELNLATVRDIPGEYWDFDAYPQFFKERIIGAPWFRREGQILAVDGDAFAGFASVSFSAKTHSAYNATTGVIRKYRGKNIGLALKVLATRYARKCGASQIATDNDSLNVPMLAINRKMGYQPQPGKYLLIHRLDE